MSGLTIRPSVTYGTECWPTRKQCKYKMSVARWEYWVGCVVKVGNIESEICAFESI